MGKLGIVSRWYRGVHGGLGLWPIEMVQPVERPVGYRKTKDKDKDSFPSCCIWSTLGVARASL